MPVLFATTLFLSASLLFWVQPMVAKMVLPCLGGTPAVWNTCMVFFQAALLAGYAYAHWLGKHLSLRWQVLVQAGLLLLGILFLPIALADATSAAEPPSTHPGWWLLKRLMGGVGLPFLAVATHGPLLQRWFSYSGHRSSGDPYFLYAASNTGSLLALLGYPLLLEPHWRLGEQGRFWLGGYLVLIVGVVLCGISTIWRAPRPRGAGPPGDESGSPREAMTAGPGLRQRLRWIALSFVPSSLLLGVTTYLTTDIASIPLLWVLPLALYLLTFIIAFTPRLAVLGQWSIRVLPMGVIGLIYLLVSEATRPVWLFVLLHLLVFLLAALACHRQLADSRPAPDFLTEYFLWISVGGVLGGMFNALAAPLLFNRIAEYPAALILACLLRPASDRWKWSRLDWAFPIGVGLIGIVLCQWVPRWTELPAQVGLGMIFGIPLLVSFMAVDRPVRFGLCLGAVLLASTFYAGNHGRPLAASRNFYGVLRVTRDPVGEYHRLVHGNTVHGRQSLSPAHRREPLSYYHKTGPLGQLVNVFNARAFSTKVGVVGLGAGAIACYAEPGQHWTFYEINPDVVAIARDTNYFSFIADCQAAQLEIVLGDARLRLRQAPPGGFGLLVLDAFSSDAIPLHLITREALDLYLSKLAPGGLLAFHISNRCLELESVLGDLAAAAGLQCRSQDEAEPGPIEIAAGKDQSHWVVMARRAEDFGRLTKDSRWLPIRGRPHYPIWTDDFSNIISVFKWD